MKINELKRAVLTKDSTKIKESVFDFQQEVILDKSKKRLEELKTGDTVATLDPITRLPKKNKITKVEVISVFGHHIQINGLPFHRHQSLMLANKKNESIATHAFRIKEGDTLIDADGNDVEVTSVEIVHEPYPFFKLTVDGDHTYILNGILVHNANRYWVGGTNTWNTTAGTKWSTTSGGGGGSAVPTASDDVFFDAASGAVTVTGGSTSNRCRHLNFTGFTGTFTGTSAFPISGSLTLGSGMTWTATMTLTFNATTSQTIDSNGIAIDNACTFNGIGGTWTLLDHFNIMSGSTSRTMTLTNGTIDADVYNVTCGIFSSNTTNTRVINMGTGTWELKGTGTVWNINNAATGLTMNEETSTIKLTNNSTSAKTVAGGDGVQYYNYWNATAGTGTCSISRAGTWNDIKVDAGRTQYIGQFGGLVFTVASITAVGTAGNGIVLRSQFTSTSSKTEIISSGGADQTFEYCTITGWKVIGARFYALTTDNNTDGGNNIGVIFATGVPSVFIDPVTNGGTAGANIELYARDNGTSIVRRGIVFDTVSRTDPGNTDPDVSAYANVVDETGTFTADDFAAVMATLSADTTYYIRGFAENTSGYAYSNEVEFTTITLSITTWKQFNAMRYDLDNDYVLANDLDENSPGYSTYASSAARGGLGWQPIGDCFTNQLLYNGFSRSFEGTFDGQGFTISGLYITGGQPDGAGDGIAPFGGFALGSVISDLGFLNVEIDNAFGSYVAGFVGITYGQVENCFVDGLNILVNDAYAVGGFTGNQLDSTETCYTRKCYVRNMDINWDTNSSYSVGGFFGERFYGDVTECYAQGTVRAGDDEVGGFGAYSWGSAIGVVINCYALVDVIETSEFFDGFTIGGFIAFLEEHAEKCWAAGVLSTGGTATEDVGGFNGDAGGTAQDCFWDTTVGFATSVAGTGKTTSEMKDIDTYTDLLTSGLTEVYDMVASRDNTKIWGILPNVNGGYPFLQRMTVHYEDAYSDAFTVNDALVRTPGKGLTEAVTIVDTISRSIGRAIAEVVTIVDVVAKNTGRAFAEVLTVVDTVSPIKIAVRAFDEIITVVDTMRARISAKVLNEIVTVVDTLRRDLGRAISEVVTVIDTIVVERGIFLFYTETITVVDNLTRTISRALAETVTVVDNLVRTVGKTLEETVTLVDTFLRSISKGFSETVTVVDTFQRNLSRVFAETFAVADSFVKQVGRSLSEVITVVDIVNRAFLVAFNEVVSIADTLNRSVSRAFSEVLTVVDLAIGWFKKGVGFIVGRNNDTNTVVGKRGSPPVGKNTNTNTGIGTRLK